jgi:hypothetical protein
MKRAGHKKVKLPEAGFIPEDFKIFFADFS